MGTISGEIGTIGILNVGHGDTKLSFDPANPADAIRAARIVKDMLRRGYALLVEVVEGDKKEFRRVYDFDENTHEYIIADFDPVIAEQEDSDEREAAAESGAEGAAGVYTPPVEEVAGAPAGSKPPRRGTRRLPAASTRGVAVGRTAGG